MFCLRFANSPILLFPLLLFIGCNKPVVVTPEKPIEVTTTIVQSRNIPIEYEFTGVAQSSHLVDIWSRVEGYLEKIDYVEGSPVKEGDLLFQIDPREFQAQVNEAKANLARENANLASAQMAVNRYVPLFEQKAASRKDLDDANTQLLIAKSAVSLYQAKLDEAELTLSYTKIISPISGLTTNAISREGTYINPSANGQLTSVSVLDPIWISISISDYYFLESQAEVAKGELILPPNYNFDVTLSMADGSPFPHHGKVSFISPVLDPHTGTLSTRGIFPNPEEQIKPGQFVRAKAVGAVRPNAIVVPQQAVLQGPKGTMVFTVDKGNRVASRPVVVGEWLGPNWVIKSGLKNGDEVVVSGVNKLKDGSLIQVVR